MPCPGPSNDDVSSYEVKVNKERYGYSASNCECATRAACEALRLLGKKAAPRIKKRGSRFLQRWWEQHVREDKLRKKLRMEEEEKKAKEEKRQALRKTALAKLSKAERKALRV